MAIQRSSLNIVFASTRANVSKSLQKLSSRHYRNVKSKESRIFCPKKPHSGTDAYRVEIQSAFLARLQATSSADLANGLSSGVWLNQTNHDFSWSWSLQVMSLTSFQLGPGFDERCADARHQQARCSRKVHGNALTAFILRRQNVLAYL